MAVTPDDVRHVAGLARVGLEASEVEPLTRQLNGILEHMDELQAVDVSGVADDPAPVAEHAPLRVDEPAADALAFGPTELAPAWEEGFFVVPRLASHDDATPASGAAPEDAP